MHYVKGAFALLVMLIMIIFAVQNLDVINVKFLSWAMSVPKFMVIVGTYVLGMITGAWLFDFLKMLFRSNPANASQ
ncbi:LapA family protein [Bythopirellula goksoeyrii]|uniref:Lipopolysaccharide assembly protein A domain-containing protein n=1 Tax=Bythopirellula goksoeyrii TaxID=1400387 RepID=A0A5B9QF38_9BACT|nr:hypothetical protein [Bythopirellula goksoeyrii]QEG37657.1 hypothetical protein Pr1d_50030 [Bythopirellula goksoeyrii]